MNEFDYPRERADLIHALRHRSRTEYGLRGHIFSVAAEVLTNVCHPEVHFRVAALLNTLGSLPDRSVLRELHELSQQDVTFMATQTANVA